MKLVELTQFLDRELNLEAFRQDHSNNGLQVEGSAEVRRAAFAVDACLATFELAAEKGVDFLFVHHGLSWGAEPRRFTGVTARRLRTLFNAGISLYAAHLPLDANPVFGNNAELSRLAGLIETEPYCLYDGVKIGRIGDLPSPRPLPEIAARLERELKTAAQICGEPESTVSRIAVVSGGGGMDALEQAASAGADLLITGELTHVMFHCARELGVKVLAFGHYATETVGPQALMRHVGGKFPLEFTFLDFPTGL